MSLKYPLHIKDANDNIMKAEDGTNKTTILGGISHPPEAKPHVKRETVLYH